MSISSLRAARVFGAAILGLGLASGALAQPTIQVAGAEIGVNLAASLEYDDNVRGSGIAKDGDFILRGAVGVRARWDITQYNYLSLGATLGYRKHFDNSDLDDLEFNVEAVPGGGLRWNVKVGPATVVLSEELTFATDRGRARAYDPASGTVDNTPSQYRRFENRAGVDVSFDVREGDLRFSLSRHDEIPVDDQFKFLRQTVWAAGAQVMMPLRSDLDAGGGVRYEDRSAKKGVLNDGTRLEVGPRATWRASEFIEISGSVFYTKLDFDATGLLADTSDSSGIDWNVGLKHDLTRDLSQSVRIERAREFGLLANSRVVERATYGMDWDGLRQAKVRGWLSREESVDSGGPFAEDQDLWQFGLALEGKTEGRLGWRASFLREDFDSNLAARTYSRHRLMFEVNYGF